MSAPIEYGRNFLRPVSPVGPGTQSFKSILNTGKGLRRPGVVESYDADKGHGIVVTSTLCGWRGESSPKFFSFLLAGACPPYMLLIRIRSNLLIMLILYSDAVAASALYR